MSLLIEDDDNNNNIDFMFVDLNVEEPTTPPTTPYGSDDLSNDLISSMTVNVQKEKMEYYLCIDVGFRNLGWCVLEQSKNVLTRTIVEHGVTSIYSKSVRGSLDWQEINQNIRYLFGEDLEILRKYSDFLEGIYIERQPRRNFNGCLLAASIFAYFSHALEENPFWGNKVPVQYMDSRKKLGPLSLLPFDVPPPTKTYYQRKKEAIRRATKLIENESVIYSQNLSLMQPTFAFESRKKKDDLADTLLMCYVKACENENLINL